MHGLAFHPTTRSAKTEDLVELAAFCLNTEDGKSAVKQGLTSLVQNLRVARRQGLYVSVNGRG